MADKPEWGSYSFARGLQVPDARSLEEQARMGGDHLLNAIGRLIRNGSDEALEMGEELLRKYS